MEELRDKITYCANNIDITTCEQALGGFAALLLLNLFVNVIGVINCVVLSIHVLFFTLSTILFVRLLQGDETLGSALSTLVITLFYLNICVGVCIPYMEEK